ncbi:MAG: T9SS type A sorting domain-containing protein [Bacteroidetes bacterium]|nr:T9SS type A sorting domain-containing protein [Bacteroidota bacterium]
MATFATQAQPALDSSNYGPVPGVAYMAHKGGQQVLPAMGSGIVWDYGEAVFAAEGAAVTFGSPGGDAPVNSTVAEMSTSFIETYFYRLDATGYRCTGRWYSEMVNASCSGSVLQVPFPFTFGSSVYSPFNCPGVEMGLAFAEGGQVQCDGVGFGTLILPSGSVDSVLLMHRTEYLNHWTLDWHSPIQIDFAYGLEQFVFLKPGTRVPLLQIELQYDGQDTLYSSVLMEDYSVGIRMVNSRNLGIGLHPNPSTGHFTMRFTNPLSADSFYSVYDAVGKLLFQRPLGKGQESEEVDLSRFGAGTYVVRITSKDGVCNERVVVQ